jgi:exodeoxyribonuclease III
MKIASFNINNIKRRLTNLLNWLHEAEPDIVCLQETKAAGAEFPAEAIRQAGYHAVCRGEKRWNGVAILARWPPVVTRMDLPGDTADGQRRYLEAAVNGVLVASIYAPNGNPQPGPKFDYKLAWLKRLDAHAAELYATGAPVVLAGDYNVVPTDLDIYSTKSWDRNALLQPESRAAYQGLLAQGWIDAVRALHPKERRCHVVCGLVAEGHDENQLFRISVPTGDHSPSDLALSPVHPQLSRRRGLARGARNCNFVRNSPTLGESFRADHRSGIA